MTDFRSNDPEMMETSDTPNPETLSWRLVIEASATALSNSNLMSAAVEAPQETVDSFGFLGSVCYDASFDFNNLDSAAAEAPQETVDSTDLAESVWEDFRFAFKNLASASENPESSGRSDPNQTAVQVSNSFTVFQTNVSSMLGGSVEDYPIFAKATNIVQDGNIQAEVNIDDLVASADGIGMNRSEQGRKYSNIEGESAGKSGSSSSRSKRRISTAQKINYNDERVSTDSDDGSDSDFDPNCSFSSNESKRSADSDKLGESKGSETPEQRNTVDESYDESPAATTARKQKTLKPKRRAPNKRVCSQCNDVFVGQESLDRHLKTHNAEQPFKCEVCEERFETKKKRRDHVATHKNESGKFACGQCTKTFVSLADLFRHNRTHSGAKPFKCDQCHLSFGRSSHLNKHQRIHTGEKPYTCDQCQQSFRRSSHLKKHQRIHAGEKPYKCDQCQKSFARSSILKDHQRTHTGEKPYKCDLCEKSFAQSSNLRRHKATHTD